MAIRRKIFFDGAVFLHCKRGNCLHNPRPTTVGTKDAAMHGSIAQLVEQQIENLRVAGSIPARATSFDLLSENEHGHLGHKCLSIASKCFDLVHALRGKIGSSN